MKKLISLLLCISMVLALMPAVFAAEEPVIIDNESASFSVKTQEKWVKSPSVVGYQNKIVYTNTQDEWAMWKADGVSGEKTVYYYKPYYADKYNDAAVSVEVYAGGKATSFTVDQTAEPKGWVELGSFTFTGDGTEYVKATRTGATGGFYTRVDAAAFAPVGYAMKDVVGKAAAGGAAATPAPTAAPSSSAKPSAAPAAGITVPNSISKQGNVTIIGRDPSAFSVKTPDNWKEALSVEGMLGKALYTNVQNEWAKWKIDGIAGEKDLYYYKMYHGDGKNDAAAEISVVAGGKKYLYTINQNVEPKGWIKLGTFSFTGDGTEYVKHTRTGPSQGYYNRVDSIALADQGASMSDVVGEATGKEVVGYDPSKDVDDSNGGMTPGGEGEEPGVKISADGKTIIVEPVAGEGGNLIGQWGKSGALKDYNEQPTYYTATPGDKAVYKPNVTTAGKVRILFYNLFFNNNDEKLKVTIYLDGETKTEEVVCSGLKLSGWHDLGEYDFKGNGKEYVEIEKIGEDGTLNTRAGSVMFQLEPDVQALPQPLERDAEVATPPPDAPPVPDWAKEEPSYFNANAFPDCEGHWASKTIEKLVSHGIVKGKSPEAFEPESFVTNAELATLFVNMLEISKADGGEPWYAPYIDAAKNAGLLDNTRIAEDPDGNADRLTLANVLYNTIKMQGKLPNNGPAVHFDEMDALTGQDKEAVDAVVAAELMIGSDGRLGLADNMTRAEAVTVMSRIMDLELAAQVQKGDSYVLENQDYKIEAKQDGSILITKDGKTYPFSAAGRVVYSEKNPNMKLQNVEEDDITYNIPSWNLYGQEGADVGEAHEWKKSESKVEGRTESIFAAGVVKSYRDFTVEATEESIVFKGTADEFGTPTFTISLGKGDAVPVLNIAYTAAKDGYYTFGYIGAPSYDLSEVEELWQPMCWTERRMPKVSYFTPEYHLPVLSSMVRVDGSTITYGVKSSEEAFEVPTYEKSRFGVVLRSMENKVQPQIFAPYFGNKNSELKAGDAVSLDTIITIHDGTIPENLEYVAEKNYGYYDFRTNADISLNQVIENMIGYGMDDYYSKFMPEYKGFSYENDAPGTTKNVSAAHPASLALLFDDSELYYRRALPLSEYMMSRNDLTYKFVDTATQGTDKLGAPSMRMWEYAALYEMSGRTVRPFLEFTEQKGSNVTDWKDLLVMYQATREQKYLDKAIESCDKYLSSRMNELQTELDRNSGWWHFFVPDYVELYEMYELTGDEKYLNASYEGARRMAQFLWYVPEVPFDTAHINEGGVAPKYTYNRGTMPMPAEETDIDAWRLSEIGLHAEAAFTSHGHRAIFMAFHAPYFMKIGSLKEDDFLKSVGRSAIVGRYENFPGYHINTGYTDVYMKKDFPFKTYEQLTYNSFHYNHIWPQISLLTDFLFSDIYDKTKGAIDMPSVFVNSYAYVKVRAYGQQPGTFYGMDGAWPYMPKGILSIDNPQINYGTFRGDNKFQIALTNQSNKDIDATVTINPDVIPIDVNKTYTAQVWIDNVPSDSVTIENGQFTIRVNGQSVSALSIDGIQITPDFAPPEETGEVYGEDSYVKIPTAVGNVYGMVLGFGEGTETIYVYTDAYKYDVKEATVEYTVNGETKTETDTAYPFEFTLPYGEDFNFKLILTTSDDQKLECPVTRIAK